MEKESPFEEFRPNANKEPFESIVKWWERRRWVFNVAVGATGFVAVTVFGSSPYLDRLTMVSIVMYGLFANLAYSVGWGLELLLLHYTRHRLSLKYFRLLLLPAGIIGSCILTFLLVAIFS